MRPMRSLTVLLALAALSGCQLFRPDASPEGKSPLRPLTPASNQSELEIFFVRLPAGDDSAISDVWKEVDEQSLAAETRLRLLRHGFRAGVIGSQLPPRISQLLHSAVPQSSGASPVDSLDTFGATRREMYLWPRQRAELVTSGVLKQFHVLQWIQGQPQGTTLEDGQAEFAVLADPLGDGRIRLELTPEVHYGPFEQHRVAGEGMFRLDNSRKKKVFEHLRLEAKLAPGDILIVGGRADRPGSLGDRFFREYDSAAPRPRLLLLRLSPGRHDPLFANAGRDGAAPAHP